MLQEVILVGPQSWVKAACRVRLRDMQRWMRVRKCRQSQGIMLLETMEVCRRASRWSRRHNVQETKLYDRSRKAVMQDEITKTC